MLKRYLKPPINFSFSKIVMSLYPIRAKNVAHDSDAGPHPIRAIFESLLGNSSQGGLICRTPIF